MTLHIPAPIEERATEVPRPTAAESAAIAVRRVSTTYEEVGSRLGVYLVNPNVVLTLADERGSADLPVQASAKELRRFVARANDVLLPEGCRIVIHAGPHRPSFLRGQADLEIVSLAGLAQVSARTTLPGISPFDAKSSWDGLREWCTQTRASVIAAQQAGKLPAHVDPVHFEIGLALGYPDRAMLGYLPVADDAWDEDKCVDARIPFSDRYDCAQPIYSFLKTDEADPAIVEHQRRWGQVLARFYGSSWHERLHRDPDFLRARRQTDRNG